MQKFTLPNCIYFSGLSVLLSVYYLVCLSQTALTVLTLLYPQILHYPTVTYRTLPIYFRTLFYIYTLYPLYMFSYLFSHLPTTYAPAPQLSLVSLSFFGRPTSKRLFACLLRTFKTT